MSGLGQGFLESATMAGSRCVCALSGTEGIFIRLKRAVQK